jgi:hypothetical protein
MEMINEILQWIAIVWAVWAINNLGTAIRKYAEVLKTMCKQEK